MADEIGSPQNPAVLISRGDKLRLTADMANLWSTGARRGLQVMPNHNPPPRLRKDDISVLVRNDTGSDRRIGDVIGIGAGLLDAFDADGLMFAGETPAATHTVFGVLRETAGWYTNSAYRQPVRAQVSGVCLAYVNFAATADKGAAPSPGEYVFRSSSGHGPIQVLTPPTSTGEQLVPVLLGRMSDDLAVLTPSGGIAARSGTTVTGVSCAAYYVTGTGLTRTLASAGFSVNVFNYSNALIPAAKYVMTSLDCWGVRYVVLESCAAEA